MGIALDLFACEADKSFWNDGFLSPPFPGHSFVISRKKKI
jgi:hypothetical protein